MKTINDFLNESILPDDVFKTVRSIDDILYRMRLYTNINPKIWQSNAQKNLKQLEINAKKLSSEIKKLKKLI